MKTLTKVSLVEKFASKYFIQSDKILSILKATAFKIKKGEVSNDQMASLLVVADQYNLNPFTREIFAFPDKQNGIVPVVSVDGWSRIINDHPQSDGFEFRASEEIVSMPGARECPEWMEVIIYRKDRSHPIIVREYLDEVYRAGFKSSDDGYEMKGPWQTHTKRFLRHKCLIQGARLAYGFSGIYDEDEAERILEKNITPERTSTPSPLKGAAGLKAALLEEEKNFADGGIVASDITTPDKDVKVDVGDIGNLPDTEVVWESEMPDHTTKDGDIFALKRITLICQKALAIPDSEIAILKIDECRTIVDEITSSSEKTLAIEAITQAVKEIRNRAKT